jgi:hypothetical protein
MPPPGETGAAVPGEPLASLRMTGCGGRVALEGSSPVPPPVVRFASRSSLRVETESVVLVRYRAAVQGTC